MQQSAPVAKNHSVSATRMSKGTVFLISVSLLDRSSLYRYVKVHCDMRKFSSHSCGANVDFTTFSHQWLLLSFVQIILSGDRLQQVTDINTTSINHSIACLLTNACLRLLLSSFFCSNLLAALRFLFNTRAQTTRAATSLAPDPSV